MPVAEMRYSEAAGWYDPDDCDLALWAVNHLRGVFAAIDATDGHDYGDRYRQMIFAALERDAAPVRSGRVGVRGRSRRDGRPG